MITDITAVGVTVVVSRLKAEEDLTRLGFAGCFNPFYNKNLRGVSAGLPALSPDKY